MKTDKRMCKRQRKLITAVCLALGLEFIGLVLGTEYLINKPAERRVYAIIKQTLPQKINSLRNGFGKDNPIELAEKLNDLTPSRLQPGGFLEDLTLVGSRYHYSHRDIIEVLEPLIEFEHELDNYTKSRTYPSFIGDTGFQSELSRALELVEENIRKYERKR